MIFQNLLCAAVIFVINNIICLSYANIYSTFNCRFNFVAQSFFFFIYFLTIVE
ncbi:hypothetical protein GLOIN_2v682267 [Rhizophagus irregularis DAOM 181602=DAOM 197198]|uniref:Uncharacterized protein n=1 Tax=Rhizophagus irregularis (strain DAOM 181602 / DAOM 197198 / MUCL 43194) TaxID=747089 RepID=A0A2P4P8J7_RHIID|nr:hypothetical protein GLOIN_2v682267 [Rhizophagus irregularis DAOM 181602=DAOM 197198]POG61687.1 hypothetical protein GLOIN_2v682267 [Rhizophagus irregularis DAOM 181602=DAOM 197198]|eukprot:XP_025168553.1 hypothetical protein GLOIN_2v682267 [Rhizophagus irregularis DAOM 181602=DAOM 197198]